MTSGSRPQMGGSEDKSLKLPDWLPDGWIMKVNRRKDGKVDKYYVSPVSGSTFRSRPEVMRYLNVEKVDGLPPIKTVSSEEHKYVDAEKVHGLPPITNISSEEHKYVDAEKVHGLPPITTTSSEEDKHCDVNERDGLLSVTTASPEEDKRCEVEHGKDSPLWLPSGWILEIRTRKTGAKAGTKYKSYFDPSTGSRFYSKAEVFRYLKDGKRGMSTSKRKKLTNAEPEENNLCSSPSNHKQINADSKDDILSLVETSPDGLPSGWIKEIKCRWNDSGLRKDPYYTDPVSGYVFRSKKDAVRYIETGEISKHAFKPKTKRKANEVYSIENESPPPISAKKLKGQGGQGTGIKRHLFSGTGNKSNRRATKKTDELLRENLFSSPADQGEHGMGSSCKAPSDAMCLKDIQAKATNRTEEHIANLHEIGLPDKLLEPAEEKELDQVIEKLLDSVSKKSPGSLDGKVSCPVSESLQNLSNMEWLEAVDKEILKPADKSLSPVSEPVGDTAEPRHKRQLKFEVGKVQMTAKQKSVGLVDSACDIIMESSNGLQRRGDNEKVELADHKPSKNLHRIPLLEERKRVDVELSVPVKATEVGLQNRKSFEPEGKTPEQGIGESKEEGASSSTGRTQPRRSKAKSEKSVPMARRASKRLAGLEADRAADIDVSDRSLKRAKHPTELKTSSVKISLDDNHEVEAEPSRLKDEPLGEQAELEVLDGVVEPAKEESNCLVASPFGDSWPDPCIEFAFKTLTGEIPVLDTTTIQGYLHGQISSVQTSTPDGPHLPVDGCLNGQDLVGVKMHNSTGKDHSLPETPARTCGRVKRLCRRTITRKTPACDE